MRAPSHLAALDQLERVREAPAVAEGAQLAPDAYARAQQARVDARRAHAAGDDVAATLDAERAVAAFSSELATARLARATVELADAQRTLDEAAAQQQTLDASRTDLERETRQLEERLEVTKARLLPAPSGSATREREAARRAAARSLAMEARLLCHAARLIGADPQSLSASEAQLDSLTSRLDAPSAPSAPAPAPAPIDVAGRARADCLGTLTIARRADGWDAHRLTDELLAELSATGRWDPTADERGVIVTLRAVYRGGELASDAAGKLTELGRVAVAHPGFFLQIVLHDAVATSSKESADGHRADAAVQAIIAGGVENSRVAVELAGASVPAVDPADKSARTRNDRVEIVFVRK